jgi:[ribosomal protein S5]-alanine N-acetyltransferase
MYILFETERLIVRHYTKDDSDNFFLLNGDVEIVRYIRPAKSRGDCDEFLAQIINRYEEKPLEGRWAAVDKYSNEFIGSFAFIPIEGTGMMQLGYALLKENWGKGYATELTLAGLDYVFTKTSLTEIFAVTETANVTSQKVLLKAGFIDEATYKEGEKELFRYRFLKSDFIFKR